MNPPSLYDLAIQRDWTRLHAEVMTRHPSVEELTEALVKTVFAENLELTQFLISAGASPNLSFDGSEYPALNAAIENTWQPGLELLLAHGGDINVRSYGGWTPLIHAVDIEADGASHEGVPPTLDFLRFLLNHGADPTLRDDRGDSAADMARRYGWHEAAKLLDRQAGEGVTV